MQKNSGAVHDPDYVKFVVVMASFLLIVLVFAYPRVTLAEQGTILCNDNMVGVGKAQFWGSNVTVQNKTIYIVCIEQNITTVVVTA